MAIHIINFKTVELADSDTCAQADNVYKFAPHGSACENY